jgi:phosphopantothenoylcysteine decarboxylase/phosphopantothenate--cysteine ligase
MIEDNDQSITGEPHPSKDILGSYSDALAGKRVALGISGSVAAVRSGDIARLLMRYGAEVYPVMSPEACRIVHPNYLHWATGNRPVTELTGDIEHVALAGNVDGKVDLYLIAPATANTVGKIARGIDDTPVTTVATTALGEGIPLIVVPAMHAPMYSHPGVRDNLDALAQMGIDVMMPRMEEGKAKIPETEEVVFRAVRFLTAGSPLAGTRVIVTAGRTVEYIDPIRVITNNSSGRMGVELARALLLAGARVELVYGRGTAAPVPGARLHRVDTAEDMLQTVQRLLKAEHIDAVIAAAAVGDWRPAEQAEEKISTHDREEAMLRMVPTPKIIDSVKDIAPDTLLLAFRAIRGTGPDELKENARIRMKKARADFIAANDVGRAGGGFESERNELFLLSKAGDEEFIPLTGKFQAAERIVELITPQLTATAPPR